MDQLCILADSARGAESIHRQVGGLFLTRMLSRSDLHQAEPASHCVVDIDLEDPSYLEDLRRWLALRPKNGKAIFVVEPGVRLHAVQAFAVGATDLVPRPLDRRALLGKLFGEIASLAGDPVTPETSNGVAAGVGALQSAFVSTFSNTAVEVDLIRTAGETVVSHIECEGLARWIDVVRKHHSLTYQHCLLVTGVAVTFASHLGFSSADRRKLALAGLLHDLGKANIPVALLEKPAPLSEEERVVMRCHPKLGFTALQEVADLDRDMLDMVLHHHEYLDGSGYPDGLTAGDLSDLTRMMTIADVFGALIERRAYRAPLRFAAAYQILEDMGPKLDRDLVREFRSIASMRGA